MDSQKVLGWLFSEAGAGWIAAFLLATRQIYTWWLRKKPQRVVCKEINTKSLTFFKGVGKKIEVYCDKKQIDKPFNLQLELYNKGTEVIKDIKLTLQFAPKTKVIDVFFEDIESEEKLNNKIIGNQVVLNIPFLNPIRPHKHKILADILCDGDTEGFKVSGSGEGWSVETIRMPNIQQLTKRLRLVLLGLIPVSIIFVFLLSYLLSKLL
jgi:hypothetical protein